MSGLGQSPLKPAIVLAAHTDWAKTYPECEEYVLLIPPDRHLHQSQNNDAHFQSRRADQLTVSGKYEDAIVCHQKAVECLDQALASIVPSSAVESLTLQRENHVKQQGILRLRNYQHLTRKQHAQKIAQAKFPEVEVRQEPERELQHRPVKSRDSQLLRHCRQEQDTLINFLENRRAGSLMTYSEYENQTKETEYRKLPKDDRIVLEELQGQNALLREHVLELLNENATLRENAEHSRRVDSLVEKVISESMMIDSSEPEAFCDLPQGGVDLRGEIEDLPPLEQPQFVFRPET